MTVAEAVLLGIVQGLTEFLPISSKTHLVIVPALLDVPTPDLGTIVFLHLGTLVALVAYFGRELVTIGTGLPRAGSEGRRTAALLVVATIPAAITGLLWEETFERLLTHPTGVAFALLATAAILVVAEWIAGTLSKRRLARPLRSAPAGRDAVMMGLAQALALLPGVSRSGSTMAAGLAGGLTRTAAARFSFLMAIPAIVGANVLELPGVVERGISAAQWAGFAAALVSGYAAVAVLLRWVRTRSFLPFAGYCVVVALAAGFVLART